VSPFSQLPAEARLWIYQADRQLTTEESASISQDLKTFVTNWLAHKVKVAGEGILIHDRFVMLAADESDVSVSGCSIDSTVHFIKELGAKYKVNFFDRFYTCYRDGDQISGCDIDTFQTLIAEGKVNDQTIVFNNTVTTVGQLRSGWEQPLSMSWQKHYAKPAIGLTL
jgi:hypothetical protein